MLILKGKQGFSDKSVEVYSFIAEHCMSSGSPQFLSLITYSDTTTKTLKMYLRLLQSQC